MDAGECTVDVGGELGCAATGDAVAQRIAEVFWEHKDELREAFAGCSLEGRGYTVEDILDYLYSKIRRQGHEVLDEQGFFPKLPVHRDGSRWVYWAEEVEIKGE